MFFLQYFMSSLVLTQSSSLKTPVTAYTVAGFLPFSYVTQRVLSYPATAHCGGQLSCDWLGGGRELRNWSTSPHISLHPLFWTLLVGT
jgi:hypothetical protein